MLSCHSLRACPVDQLAILATAVATEYRKFGRLCLDREFGPYRHLGDLTARILSARRSILTRVGAPGRIEQRNRLRREPLPHDTVVMLRGGPDTVAKLVRHAIRTQQRWALDDMPLVGVSVFCALDPEGLASLDGILASRMRSYPVVHRFPAGKLHAAGFELPPTGGRPHYTIRMLSGDEAEAAKLLAVFGPPRKNRHHESHAG